jgi:hypothetical protein
MFQIFLHFLILAKFTQPDLVQFLRVLHKNNIKKMENDNNEIETSFNNKNINNNTNSDDIINILGASYPGRKTKTWVPLKHQQKMAKKMMLDQAVEMYIDAVKCNVGKNVPPLTFCQICSSFRNPTWMTRHTIFYHHKNYNKNCSNDLIDNPPLEITTANTEISDLTSVSRQSRNKGGRPSLLHTDSMDD